MFLLTSCGVSRSLKDRPDLSDYTSTIPERVKIADTIFAVCKNQLRKNREGLWELYIHGNPLERGMSEGSLTRELIKEQEAIFFDKVNELVPSKMKQYLLRKFLAWFNRKSYQYITNEYKAEIYGMSRYGGDKYDYIADDYLRSLYLHSAHDIGHALKDLALVGCTSFAVWGKHSADGQLLVGRNFDFYAGDEFAKTKIIAFVNPSEGYKFMSVTWPGMIGVVSGMNDQGLTVTINAGRSDIPLVAKTPISLVTREILQYASNIDEAVEIARKRQVFVSEAILVGSAKDKKAVSIEVSPNKIDIYEVGNSGELLCTNHFQSNAYVNDKKNNKQKLESHSQYRYERLTELLADKKVDTQIAVNILRNKEGLHNAAIGYGNEKVLNQLLAHHGIVFKPEELKVWISSAPYQLGAFVCYDLDKVFQKFESQNFTIQIQNINGLIPPDPFLNSAAYKKYEKYRILSHEITNSLDNGVPVENLKVTELIKLNPNFWEVYYVAGKVFYKKGYYRLALTNFEKALTKEVTTVPDKENINKFIKKIKRKIK